MQEYNGDLHFMTDVWSSPNHHTFMAVTVHLEVNSEPLALLLDIVKVPWSHSSINLVVEFTKILKKFDITDKVSYTGHCIRSLCLPCMCLDPCSNV